MATRRRRVGDERRPPQRAREPARRARGQEGRPGRAGRADRRDAVTTQHALLLLVDRRRIQTLPDVAQYLRELADARKGIAPRRGHDRRAAERRLLRAPPGAAREDDRQEASSSTASTDPALIAGVVTRIGDRILDGSPAHAPAVAQRRAAPQLTPPPPRQPRREQRHAMQLRAEEISAIIKKQIQNYEKAALTTETGTVLSVGDGIARVYGLEGAMAGELARVPGRPHGPRAQPRAGQRRRGALRRRHERQGGRRSSSARAASWTCPSARRSSVASSTRSGMPDRRQGPDRDAAPPPRRDQGAGHPRAPAGQGAAADGHQGHRRA